MIIKFSLFFIFFYISSVNAYVFSLDNDGNKVKWSSNVNTVRYYLDASNNRSLNTSSVNTIFTNSLNQWNSASLIKLEGYTSDGNRSNNRNDVFFSSSDLFFPGSGIVGLTMVAYEEETGEIVETDIVLNDNLSLSTNPNSDFYIGDIFSHEVGHSIGMGHSEVQHSTMFYKLTNGQDTLSDDDKAGAYALYPDNDKKSSINGRVVGKDSSIGIFGAHISAISLDTLELKASAISDINGNFSISGLDSSDQYFLYTKPIDLKEHIPNYYFAANSNFCLNNRNYVGSFYNSCQNKDEGYPQAINLADSTSVNVGNVSIRCTLESPPRYLLSKGGGEFELPMQDTQFDSSLGNTFVGFFNLNEIINQTEDRIKIDLSSINIPEPSNYLEEYFLEVKVTSQPFYSKIRTKLEIEFFDYSLRTYPTSLEVNSDGNPILDYIFRLPLENGFNNENIFNLKLKPQSIRDISLIGIDNNEDGIDDLVDGYYKETSFEVDDFFPEGDSFSENRYIYLFSATLVRRDSVGNYEPYSSKVYSSFDNSECVDAPNSVNLNSLSEKTATDEEEEFKGPSAVACGSIDTGGNGDSGGALMSLIFGIILVYTVFSRRLFKNLYVLFVRSVLG